MAGCDGAIGLSDLAALLSHYGSLCVLPSSYEDGASQAGSDSDSSPQGDPLTDWILSATPEEVLQWWYDGMPNP